jgi:hypothetical protein
MKLSAPEQRLLDFAHEQFGEHLSQFLLAGLGAEDEVQIWLFTVTFTDKQGVDQCREIKVEADERPDIITLLPRHREPLVILALLRLLIVEREMTAATLYYEPKQVLGLLGWEDSVKSRLIINEAIERYFNMSYNWLLNGEELKEKNLSFYNGQGRIISGYGRYYTEGVERSKRLAGMVEFGAPFVEGLVGRRLFDLDWNSVRRKIFSRSLGTNSDALFE